MFQKSLSLTKIHEYLTDKHNGKLNIKQDLELTLYCMDKQVFSFLMTTFFIFYKSLLNLSSSFALKFP